MTKIIPFKKRRISVQFSGREMQIISSVITILWSDNNTIDNVLYMVISINYKQWKIYIIEAAKSFGINKV